MTKPKLSEDDLRKELKVSAAKFIAKDRSLRSDEYIEFRKQLIPIRFSLYEKACNISEKVLKLSPNKKNHSKLQEALDICHLNTTPIGVTSFAVLFPFLIMALGVLVSYMLANFVLGPESFLFFMIVFMIFGIVLIMPLSTLPLILANSWRLKASSQMVLAVFYLVSYMRHTSNLELAIKFTSDHLAPPLSIDFKKILWNIEASRFGSLKDSVDYYLESWKESNMEFVESMHLIQSSLYETNEKRRIKTLERALSLTLEATYEKMLHFAQDLKSPITTLHMLGVLLPILGLIILPLVVGFMGNIQWYHLAVIYNIFLPLMVLYFGKVILSKRPSGYGQADLLDINPELRKYSYFDLKIAKKNYNINPKYIAVFLSLIIMSFGFAPLLIHNYYSQKGEVFDIILNSNNQIQVVRDTQTIEEEKSAFSLLEYRLDDHDKMQGPFGLGATLLSLTIPFGLAFGLSVYYFGKTNKLVNIREKTKELENEFASALYQLGNRIGDGLPAEIAFPKVAAITSGSTSGKFFGLVSDNIATLGMGVEDAIFNKRYGAINKFPSPLIESSMKVFVEGVKKGPDVAANALMNISSYIKEMHKVEERLQDLMVEITSSMESQINFLAPLISGIVIGLTTMITTILGTLGSQIKNISFETGNTALPEFFKASVPPYFFQIVVGLYIVQVSYLLTLMLNTIRNGYDPLEEKYLLGKNLKKSVTLYTIVAFIVMVLFNIIAAMVITKTQFIPGA